MGSKTALVLGLGMQGQAALHDLVVNDAASKIIAADSRSDARNFLQKYPAGRVSFTTVNAADHTELRRLMDQADIIVEALPPSLALPVGKLAAESGVSLVSSMYYVDPSETDTKKIEKMRAELNRIDRLAEQQGITVLTEFGLDPGIDLVMGAHALSEFSQVDRFDSYGTGLPIPKDASNPLKYKFSWSVLGTLGAYKRPAKVIAEGQVRDIPGNEILSPENVHTINVDEFNGALECYANGNAANYLDVFDLRGQVQEMGRYACRYPGHCAFWDRMANSGFLDEQPLQVNEKEISPIEFVATLLSRQDQFSFGPDESDMIMVRVDITGWSEGKPKRVAYQLIDRRDMKTGFTAMQRTVGFTMGIGARAILEGSTMRNGLVSPVEFPLDLLKSQMAAYDISITREELPWEEESLRTKS